jgi:hypothetical protein
MMNQKHGSRLVKSQLVVNAIERIFNEPSSAIEEVNYGSGYRTPQTAPAWCDPSRSYAEGI